MSQDNYMTKVSMTLSRKVKYVVLSAGFTMGLFVTQEIT